MTDPDPDPSPMSLDDQLCFSLYAASMAMTRVYKPLLDRLGLTYPQYLVLHVLWEDDGRTVGAIANRLALEPSTVTPLVKRLAAAGLVTRTRDLHDERQVRVRLTEGGEGLRGESECLSRTILAQTGLRRDQVTVLAGQVQALRRALAASGKE